MAFDVDFEKVDRRARSNARVEQVVEPHRGHGRTSELDAVGEMGACDGGVQCGVADQICRPGPEFGGAGFDRHRDLHVDIARSFAIEQRDDFRNGIDVDAPPTAFVEELGDRVDVGIERTDVDVEAVVVPEPARGNDVLPVWAYDTRSCGGAVGCSTFMASTYARRGGSGFGLGLRPIGNVDTP